MPQPATPCLSREGPNGRRASMKKQRQHRAASRAIIGSQIFEVAMKSVVITGASTGIGFACSKLLLARGFRVFGSVRKPADAERLRSELGANFTPLLFDVTDEAAVKAAASE